MTSEDVVPKKSYFSSILSGTEPKVRETTASSSQLSGWGETEANGNF